MMNKQARKHSLILRFGLALGGIIFLAFVSMLSSIVITESITGMGTAINQSGSLRMQSFQIAADLVYRESKDPDNTQAHLYAGFVQEFEARLYHQKLKNIIPKDVDSPIQKSYQNVTETWEKSIKPVLYIYENIGNPEDILHQDYDKLYWQELTISTRMMIRQRYMDLVKDFVNKIDLFVKDLETEVEAKIKTLHLIESVSFFLAIAIVLVTMLFIHSRILSPLNMLMVATERIRSGDFSYKASVKGNNELSELAHTFNAMSEELSITYTEQEQEIREKTEALRQKKNAMELLYHTTETLSLAPTDSSSYKKILENIKQYMDIDSGLICLSNAEKGSGHVLASCFSDHACYVDCRKCHHKKRKKKNELIFPIQDNNKRYGLLILHTDEAQLKSWQTSTLKIISEQIGSALNIASSTIKEREHALTQERSHIARELHDSLAQSLSYLKIEISRIQALLNKKNSPELIQPIVTDVRYELNNAYRQLRELLTTFRLSIDTNELNQTINQAIEAFRQQQDVAIHTDIRLKDCEINPHEAIHLVYILKEALNNVYKHAKASQVWIELRSSYANQVVVKIQDDGIGFDPEQNKQGHHGLFIMAERGKALNGDYAIRARTGGGVSIKLRFTPKQYQKNSTNQGNISSWISQI